MSEQPINPPEIKAVDFGEQDQVAFDRHRCRQEVEATSVNISRGVIYAERFAFTEGDPTWIRHYCFDQQKRNLLALVCPHVKTLDQVESVIDIAEDIDKHMHREMREMLRMEPLAFLGWFQREDTDAWELVKHFPDGYLVSMMRASDSIYDRYNNMLPINFK